MKGKRILLCCNRTLNIGGIEKALTTFLRAFNTKDNEVLLVLHSAAGSLHKDIPLDKIHVFYTDSIDPSERLKQDIRNFQILDVISGIWNRIMLRCAKHWYARIMYTYRIIRRDLVLPGHFDCAISFTTDYSDLSMIVEADADKRICFVHGDAARDPYTAKLNDHLVKKMDKIYAVSEQAKELFTVVHPDCHPVMDVLHNIILEHEIREKAAALAEGMVLDGSTCLCTVGRLSEEKGQQLIPETARSLRDSGWKFRWYLVGDGPLRPNLEKQIKSLQLQDQVILLGSKTNPYPYMERCDIYVQPSFSEARCTTTLEAKILYKPVVTTNAPGMSEQFSNGSNGLITDSMTAYSLAASIQMLMERPALREMFSNNLRKSSGPQEDPLDKLYEFIG